VTLREAYDELVGLYRGWHVLEHSGIYTDAQDIIDLDFCPDQHCTQFSSRREVLTDLSRLRADLIRYGPVVHPVVLEDLNASQVFLRALLGESLSFRHFVLELFGFDARPVSFKRLLAILGEINRLAAELGMEYSTQDRQRYFDRFKVNSAVEVETLIRSSQSHWIDRLSRFVDIPAYLPIKTEIAEEDKPWSFSVTGGSRGITLTINSHSRHTFTVGQCDYIPSHEVAGHVVQFLSWSKLVSEETVPAVLGLISTHHPTIVLSEGLSQALPYFISSEFEMKRETLFAKKLRELRDMVLANAQIMLLGGQPIDSAWDYCTGALHFVEEAEIERELSQRSLDPLQRAYQFCYAPSFLAYKSIADSIDKRDVGPFLHSQYQAIPSPKKFWSSSDCSDNVFGGL